MKKQKEVLKSVYTEYPELRFCKIRNSTKKPFERDWTNKPYTWEQIQSHVDKEKNFGVICGYGGLLVVDSDTLELKEAVQKSLPETLRVKTGSGGTHDYFFCKELKKKIVLQNGEKHFGEVQSYGSQVVGAGSIHPNGDLYEVLNNKPISTITYEQLILAIKPFMKEVVEAEKEAVKEVVSYGASDINSISITSVMDTSGFKRASNGELYGSNKWHGSQTGMNTWINESKNVAHCFRCNCGFNVAQAIALNEKIISNCSDKLSKEDFIKVLNIAKERYGLQERKVEDIFDAEEKQEYRKVRISGKLHNGKLFWAIPIQHNGKYQFVVITEDKQTLKITSTYFEAEKKFREALEQCKKSGIKITQFEINDLKNKFFNIQHYDYFIYEGIEYRFIQELFYKDGYNINLPNKRIFELLKTKIERKKLFDKLKQSLKDYYDHSNEIEYDLLISCAIITYIHFGLGRTLYLLLQGLEDTGKSTAQRWFSNVQMNGRFGGKASIPVSVRMLHYFGVALNQDEIEKMGKDEKVIFFGVANSGFDINGTYELVNTNKKRLQDQIEVLYTFGFKSFSANDLFGFDKSFLSRCYELVCTRKNRETKDIRKIEEKDKLAFQELTNELFVYCLTNYSKIEKDILEVQKQLEKEGTFGRKADVNSIILGIIKHFKEDYSEAKQELEAKQGLDRIEASADTKDSLALIFIAKKFMEQQRNSLNYVEVSNKEIREFLDKELNLSDKKTHSRTIGAILRKYNLLVRDTQAKRESDGFKYTIAFNDFKDQIERFKFKEIVELIKNQSSDERGKLGSLHSFSSFNSGENVANEHNELNELSSPALKSNRNLSNSGLKEEFDEVFKNE